MRAVRDEGVYTPQPDATFHVGDVPWVYFEVRGFELRETDGKYEIWVQWTQFQFYDPEGNLMGEFSDVSGLAETVAEKFDWISFWIPLGEAETTDPLGEYRVEVKVVDKLTGDTATESITFILE